MIIAMQLGSPVLAEPSVDQLVEIKELLAQNDVAALRNYLDDYPELVQGDSQLAVLLRKFLLESKHLPNMLSDSNSAPENSSNSNGRGADNNGSY